MLLALTEGAIVLTINNDIDNKSVLWRTDPPTAIPPAGITVNGKVDGSSVVFLETPGNITITGKIDGGSSVTLKAGGNVIVGTTGGNDNMKIDGGSNVKIVAGGSVTFGSYIHKATVDVSAHGGVTVPGEIGYGARLRFIADGNVTVGDKIYGHSRVELTSNRGSVTLDKNVTESSKIWLTAGMDIRIGQLGGDGDKKIDNSSFVSATAGGLIDLGGAITDSNTVVDFAACGAISIGKNIAGGAQVRLKSAAGKITATDGLSDSQTKVTSFPMGAFSPALQNGAPAPLVDDWTAGDPLCLPAFGNGSWWENWSQTFGYVAAERIVPRSLADLIAAVKGSGNVDRPDPTPVKAVGGGWSFTDASLPLPQTDVDVISILNKGRRGRQDMHDLLDGLPDSAAVPMDILPGAVTLNNTFSTTYNQTTFRQVTSAGAQLPSPATKARLIDTRGLCSSLQCDFPGIRTTQTYSPAGLPVPLTDTEILFHVEAGITIADLQQLLDHQFPRLALEATGGSPGATLAGTLSTATHGGEFTFKLLVDQVRAVHLIGPGGDQWWIEGDIPVADPTNLQARYGKFGPLHFIGGAWTSTGLNAQDVLNATTVAMGTMGVIYSVVLRVVPQFGIHQVVTSLTWQRLLALANVTEAQLIAGDPAANVAIVNTVLDGGANGTGILKANNIYGDLAINPINLDCWIVNRETTPIPDDANNPSTSLNDYMDALTLALSKPGNGGFSLGDALGIFHFGFSDFFPNVLNGGPETTSTASNLLGFVTRLPDVLVGTLATACVQVAANMVSDTNSEHGLDFFGGVLTGFFHAMQGTRRGVDWDFGINGDSTAVSYKVGAIGWPDTGVPGRGFEIALDQTNAFTFLQTALIQDVLLHTMRNGNKPLVGYISIRICPPTQTLLGMQQYSPLSVMMEVVGYRSPEANEVMDAILDRVISFAGKGPKPLLHWGLENGRATPAFLAASPLGQTYKGTMTRLDAFRAVRKILQQSYPQVFDNAFTARLGL